MIQRDYILRMLEDFFAVLSRIRALKQGQQWDKAGEELDSEFQRLVKAGPEAIADLSDTELMARLIQGEPTLVVRQKSAMLTSLLKEAGDIAAGRGETEKSRRYYLKGLNLLLEVLATGDVGEFPEFAPRVEGFTAALGDSPLPLTTLARLMQHHERLGEFGKAENELFEMVEANPQNQGLLEFGIAFYERLAAKTDGQLEEGGLPRMELESGLAELRQGRRASG